jgi:hypothetical protein
VIPSSLGNLSASARRNGLRFSEMAALKKKIDAAAESPKAAHRQAWASK